MPCSSILSATVSKRLTARIQELLNDGLSDSEIVRAIRREANTTRAWPEMSFGRIKKFISEVMEAEEAKETASETSETSETSEPSFDSDEEDEEYVPEEDATESESESEDDLVDEDESEDESDAEEDEEDEEEVQETRSMTICFDRNQDGTDLDRLVITPQGDGTFAVEMAYDLTSSTGLARRANFFEGDADSIDLYLGDILRLVALDDLPFHSLEFAIPFFPNVSLRPRSLCKKAVRKALMNAIRQFLEHYEA